MQADPGHTKLAKKLINAAHKAIGFESKGVDLNKFMASKSYFKSSSMLEYIDIWKVEVFSNYFLN